MIGWLKRLRRPKLDANDQRVLDNIRDHGCHVMWIFDAEGDAPEFCYSIGFPVTVGQHEVIVFGLKRDVMHVMVNEMRRRCADGLVLEDGLRVSGLLQGYDCILRHVTDAKAIGEHFGVGLWYHWTQHRKELAEAYQIVWPSAATGLFPWDEGCAESVIARQPALYAPGAAA